MCSLKFFVVVLSSILVCARTYGRTLVDFNDKANTADGLENVDLDLTTAGKHGNHVILASQENDNLLFDVDVGTRFVFFLSFYSFFLSFCYTNI